MLVKDERGNLGNIELFEPLAFSHSESAGRRFAPDMGAPNPSTRGVYPAAQRRAASPDEPPVHTKCGEVWETVSDTV
jgi:hypothetical protein